MLSQTEQTWTSIAASALSRDASPDQGLPGIVLYLRRADPRKWNQDVSEVRCAIWEPLAQRTNTEKTCVEGVRLNSGGGGWAVRGFVDSEYL